MKVVPTISFLHQEFDGDDNVGNTIKKEGIVIQTYLEYSHLRRIT